MNIVVQKYGGTSVATPEKIKRVAQKIIRRKNEGYGMVVTVSAMGNTTDTLVDLAKKISNRPNAREMDVLLTTGEQISISLLALALWEQEFPAVSFTASQLGIRTTNTHQKAKILDIDTSRIHQALSQDKIVVVAGYQGIGENQDITTLGRGGSDTSAVALAAKLGATCEIYTDVDGIYTMDPRKLTNAKKLERITSEEMMEMASLGAGVLHPRSVEMAHRYRVPLYVASAAGHEPGTTIVNGGDCEMEESVVTGMTSSHSDLMLRLLYLPENQKSLQRIFCEMAKEEVNVDMISQMTAGEGRMHVSFTLPREEEGAARNMMEKWSREDNVIQWEVDTDIVKMSIVGIGMRTHSGVAGKVFDLLSENGIRVRMVTTSEINLSWVIDAKDEPLAIEAIGKGFGLTDEPVKQTG